MLSVCKHNTSAIQDTVYYLISWAWSFWNSTTNVARAVSQTGFQPPIPNAHSSLLRFDCLLPKEVVLDSKVHQKQINTIF